MLISRVNPNPNSLTHRSNGNFFPLLVVPINLFSLICKNLLMEWRMRINKKYSFKPPYFH